MNPWGKNRTTYREINFMWYCTSIIILYTLNSKIVTPLFPLCLLKFKGGVIDLTPHDSNPLPCTWYFLLLINLSTAKPFQQINVFLTMDSIVVCWVRKGMKGRRGIEEISLSWNPSSGGGCARNHAPWSQRRLAAASGVAYIRGKVVKILNATKKKR